MVLLARAVLRTQFVLAVLLACIAPLAAAAAPTHVGVKPDDVVRLTWWAGTEFRRVGPTGLVEPAPFVVPSRKGFVLTDVNVGVFAGPASGFVAVRPRLTGCLGAGGPLFQNLADALVQLAASGYGGTTVSLTSGAVVGPGCGFTLQTSSFQGGSPVVTVELYGYLTRAPR